MPFPVRPSALASVLLLAPLAATAQYPANNQIGPVDNRVGGDLYGHGNTTRYPVPNQIRLLPSEERYAIWRSGTLRSEYEMNRASYGPLPPEGLLNYVTRRSPLQRALNVAQPQLVNPAYDPDRMAARANAADEPAPTGFPRNAQEGVYATNRVPGARPNVPNQRPGAGQPLPNPLPPIEPTGPAETEPGRIVPVQPGPARPAPSGTGESARSPQVVVPSLTGAPDVPLPSGQLSKDVSYDPNTTRSTMFLSRPPLQKQ